MTIKDLKERIFNMGLLAGVPAVAPEDMLRSAEALVAGGIYGLILPWSKHVAQAAEQIHARFPHLLLGVQGPYQQSCQVFASGALFVVDTANAPAHIQVPFFLRKGNDLMDGARILAKCSNKIVSVSQIKQQKWDEITFRARQTIQEMLGFELRHVGINHPDESAADQTASSFEKIFGFPKIDKGGAYFAGPYIEAMKKPFYGTHGHIAIATNNVARAVWYLEQQGVKFNRKSAGYNPDGTLRVIYLREEIGGFAVHLLQK